MAYFRVGKRGGLVVDRDSLHASPEYARQVEAAKQLRERKVDADVEKAVESLSREIADPEDCAAWQTILAALRDQEAEIDRLRADLSDADERAAMRSRERTESVMRAEKAEALLREALPYCDTFPDLLRDGGDELRDRITAHLGGEYE